MVSINAARWFLSSESLPGDLKKRQLCVRHSVWKGHLETPKGGRLRYIPLTTRLAATLQEGRLKGPFVFCGADGAMVDEKTMGDHVDHAARSAAGHVDLKTTQRYMHLSPAALEGAIRLLEANHPAVQYRGNVHGRIS